MDRLMIPATTPAPAQRRDPAAVTEQLLPAWLRGEPGAINVPLLRMQLEWATDEASRIYDGLVPPRIQIAGQWCQPTWASALEDPATTACGTAYCLAGHTVVDAGHELAWRRETDEEFVEKLGERWTSVETTDGQSISALAQQLLGLTPAQARELFDGDNRLDRLWWLAWLFTDGEIQIPPEFAGYQPDRDFARPPWFHTRQFLADDDIPF
jgi:hypothetical protein